MTNLVLMYSNIWLGILLPENVQYDNGFLQLQVDILPHPMAIYISYQISKMEASH